MKDLGVKTDSELSRTAAVKPHSLLSAFSHYSAFAARFLHCTPLLPTSKGLIEHSSSDPPRLDATTPRASACITALARLWHHCADVRTLLCCVVCRLPESLIVSRPCRGGRQVTCLLLPLLYEVSSGYWAVSGRIPAIVKNNIASAGSREAEYGRTLILNTFLLVVTLSHRCHKQFHPYTFFRLFTCYVVPIHRKSTSAAISRR